jgi:hypothetical protein
LTICACTFLCVLLRCRRARRWPRTGSASRRSG